MPHKQDSGLAFLDAAAQPPVKLCLANNEFLCRVPQVLLLYLGLGFLFSSITDH